MWQMERSSIKLTVMPKSAAVVTDAVDGVVRQVVCDTEAGWIGLKVDADPKLALFSCLTATGAEENILWRFSY